MNKCPQCRLLVEDGLGVCPSCNTVIPGAWVRGTPAAGSKLSPPREPMGPRTTPTIAVVGFVLALVPLCLNIVGVILGVIALIKISDQPRRYKGKGLAIAAIAVGASWTLLGMLAALTIPGLVEYRMRSQQSEAKQLLRQVQLTQASHREQHGRYALTFAELGLELEVYRYAFFLADDSVQPPAPLENPEPSHASADAYRAVATGNLDGDPTLDIWAIDHTGDLQHVVDDVDE